MKERTWLSVALSALFGAAVWALSPVLNGAIEPWDGSFGYYLGGLALAGFASALISPLPAWGHYVGSLVGQIAYVIGSTGLGVFAFIGIPLTAFCTIAVLPGIGAALAIRLACMRPGKIA